MVLGVGETLLIPLSYHFGFLTIGLPDLRSNHLPQLLDCNRCIVIYQSDLASALLTRSMRNSGSLAPRRDWPLDATKSIPRHSTSKTKILLRGLIDDPSLGPFVILPSAVAKVRGSHLCSARVPAAKAYNHSSKTLPHSLRIVALSEAKDYAVPFLRHGPSNDAKASASQVPKWL